MASPARSIRSTPRSQTERLEARVDHEQKTFFQRAAALRGVSLKEFMVTSMREAAVRTSEELELVLSVNGKRPRRCFHCGPQGRLQDNCRLLHTVQSADRLRHSPRAAPQKDRSLTNRSAQPCSDEWRREGVVVGLAGSAGAAMLMGKLLFGVQAWDAATLVGVAFVLTASAMLASYIPARRAASVNRTDALRAE